ncbi:MAG: AAA family ATPase [Oscillospiraceae bacterium]
MANLVITIGRENGGGRRPPALAANRQRRWVSWRYDSELINETAKASGFAKSFVETHEEQRAGQLPGLARDGRRRCRRRAAVPRCRSFQAQSEVILHDRRARVVRHRRAAGRSDCVPRDDPNVALVNLFVHAPLAARIRRESARTNTTPAEAEKRIRQVDKERAAYYNFFSSKRWGDAQAYDLCVNTDGLEISEVAKLVLRYLELRGLR